MLSGVGPAGAKPLHPWWQEPREVSNPWSGRAGLLGGSRGVTPRGLVERLTGWHQGMTGRRWRWGSRAGCWKGLS